MKKLLLFIFIVLHSKSFAQNLHCGTDEMHQTLFQEHPEYNQGIQRAYESLTAFTQEFAQHPPKSNATYIIPVVFHIIHQNGMENISDLQIQDAVKQVNLQFRKLNGDTTDILPVFQSLAADGQIEIRLAQKDPNGNCTSGITRTVSSLTTIGDHQVKSLIQWPPDKYLNVYVCVAAAGLAGHALLPAAADTIPQWDGIVMQHSYIGTIGTSDYFRRTVLTHEIGHYLNLQHIWGGNNVPNYYYLPVGQAGNCAFDDEVADTPNSIGWSSCNLSANSCGQLENVQNYMDYAYCARMFTQGQVTRMHACLNDTIANRSNLWQPANLIATGTDGSNTLCAAKWESDRRIVCVGDSIHFTDVSYHGTHSRTWTFTGGTASSLTDSSTAVVYSSPGFYSIGLSISDGSSTLSATATDYIYVIPQNASTMNLNEGFENGVAGQFWQQNYTNNGTWVSTSVGSESLKSFYAPHFSASETKNYELISLPINVDALSSLAIAYDWAYRKSTSGDGETFNVYVSNDCGNFWQLRKTYGPSQIASVSLIDSSEFVPQSDVEWKHDTIFVNSAATLNTHLMVKFEFVGWDGNNFFLDNIRAGDVNSLFVNEIEKNGFAVYPNPVNDKLVVLCDEAIQEISVFDNLGRKIPFQMKQESGVCSVFFDQLSNGYCTIKISTASQVFTKRILVRQN
ncbi:MAG: M43 family zinc metalloprotease [Fluviicola sp.]